MLTLRPQELAPLHPFLGVNALSRAWGKERDGEGDRVLHCVHLTSTFAPRGSAPFLIRRPPLMLQEERELSNPEISGA